MLLKILYSSEVKAGMTQEELKPIIAKLLNKWQKNGTINNAQKEVVKGGLYKMMGYR